LYFYIQHKNDIFVKLYEKIECWELHAKFFFGIFWHFKLCLKQILKTGSICQNATPLCMLNLITSQFWNVQLFCSTNSVWKMSLVFCWRWVFLILICPYRSFCLKFLFTICSYEDSHIKGLLCYMKRSFMCHIYIFYIRFY
jgi:hypothetical protein